jgi:hypothetical protein
VNMVIRGLEDDRVDARVRFQNIHYFAAAASLFGTDAQGAYEYDGKQYVGRFMHAPNFNTCVQCHDAHNLEMQMDRCTTCHAGARTPQDIRLGTADYDGDGDVREGRAAEISALKDKLYSAIQTYAKEITTTAIAYNPDTHPYFFKDLNADGKAEGQEAVSANQWTTWTPRLLRAAYNYQFAKKDPGIFAHNPRYAVQILYDSLEDLGKRITVDMTGLVRP